MLHVTHERGVRKQENRPDSSGKGLWCLSASFLGGRNVETAQALEAESKSSNPCLPS